jgi:hypothetical protein
MRPSPSRRAAQEIEMAAHEEIIRNFYEVAEKEPERFRSLFTEHGCWWDVPAGVTYHGDDIARTLGMYAAAFPDMHRELDELHVDGDVVVVQLTLTGTHLGDLPTALGTIPATGRSFYVPCVDVFHLEGGQVSTFDCYYASTILLGQIGVLSNLEASVGHSGLNRRRSPPRAPCGGPSSRAAPASTADPPGRRRTARPAG